VTRIGSGTSRCVDGFSDGLDPTSEAVAEGLGAIICAETNNHALIILHGLVNTITEAPEE